MFDILSQSHCFLWILSFDEFAWGTVDDSYWLRGLKVKGCHRKFEPCLLMSVLLVGYEVVRSPLLLNHKSRNVVLNVTP